MLQSEHGQDVEKQIFAIMEEIKSAGYADQMQRLEQLFCRKYAVAQTLSTPSPEDQSPLEHSSISNVAPEHDHNSRRKQQQRDRHLRRLGSYDSDLRSRISTVKGLEKLELFKKIEAEVEAIPSGERMSSAMRTLVHQTVYPVLRCLRNHCDDDAVFFMNRWGKRNDFPHNKFSSKRCSGRLTNCGYMEN